GGHAAAADLPDGAHHVLNDVGAGERAAQLGKKAESNDGRDSSSPSRILKAALENIPKIAEQELVETDDTEVAPPGISAQEVKGKCANHRVSRCINPQYISPL